MSRFVYDGEVERSPSTPANAPKRVAGSSVLWKPELRSYERG
ncbi:MAG TPA: hypothetical protein VNY29_13535 [Terriglobales bacterium]|nr:hypothetical protein [Terriglobales bacterium]